MASNLQVSKRQSAGGRLLLGAGAAAFGIGCAPSVFTTPFSQQPANNPAVVEGTLASSQRAPAPAAGTASAPAATAAAGAALAIGAAALRTRRARRSADGAARCQQSRCAMQARGGGDGPLVVIAGPPAAGKGTQCDKIKDKFGYVHISTGDILRENVKNGTELGKKAKEYMDSGKLVPSELIVDLVKDRLAKDDVKEKGCLLDGFPRAPDQAQAMVDAGLKVQKFLLIKVPDETLVERGCGRRLDPETGDIYHLKFKPPPEDIVDRLVHRSDDKEEQIRVRLGQYHSQIDGILPFFKEVVAEIDGTGKPDEVFGLVSTGLDGI